MPATLLELDGITFADEASRGITVQVSPIVTGALRRDVNGNLVDLTLPEHRKRQVTISCNDQDAPEVVNVWRGKVVDVTLIEGLGLEETGGPIALTMMVDSLQTTRNEWDAATAWTMTLLEV